MSLGWQRVYDPAGYYVNASLPLNCSLSTWQSLGSLTTLKNLTLTGTLPDLPDQWAANGTFPALQAMNFSGAALAGSLPSSWSSRTAFPQLQTLDFRATKLSATLPDTWGQHGSFSKLTELYLDHTDITGVTLLVLELSPKSSHAQALMSKPCCLELMLTMLFSTSTVPVGRQTLSARGTHNPDTV